MIIVASYVAVYIMASYSLNYTGQKGEPGDQGWPGPKGDPGMHTC